MARPPFDHFRFVAPIYDRVFTADGSDHAALREALALPAEGLLLDAGGGTGRVSAHLRSYTGGVVVVDVSRGMLAQAREKNALLPALGQVERLPFADGQFARILIVDAFHHFFHHAEAVEDLWRVLAPGGRPVIPEPVAGAVDRAGGNAACDAQPLLHGGPANRHVQPLPKRTGCRRCGEQPVSDCLEGG